MTSAYHIDFETRSATNLRDSGVYRYCEDPLTGVWVLRFRLDDGVVEEWRPGWAEPVALLNHIAAGGIVKAHNSAFERLVWNKVVRRMYPHWPQLTIEQMDCTMARAAAVGLPQGLGDVCRVLGSEAQKDNEGYSLMMKMCKPRRFRADGTPEWWDEPANQDRQSEYCASDVLAECGVDVIIPPLTDYERKVWHLDQLINDRGVPIDVTAVRVCADVVTAAKKQADRIMREITDRAVPKCSNDNKLIQWIQGRGIDCTTVKKSEQAELIFIADLRSDPIVREAIELRGDAKKTSTAKYAAMLDCVCEDNRIRGLLNYHGAGPGRWAGRLVQPQNFPRVDYDEDGEAIDGLLDMAHSGMSETDIYDTLVLTHGERGKNAPLRILSKALRAMFKAPEGKRLVGGDFSNIEGRINAWNAREQWKLDAFDEYDMGIGPDLYKVTAARIAGKDIEQVSKAERQSIGKTPELACLSPDTLVLTSNGIKVITSVTKEDRLWDGMDWVGHAGVKYMGRKNLIKINGIKMTPDHLVLVKGEWLEAGTVNSSRILSAQSWATGLASLRSLVLYSARKGVLKVSRWLVTVEPNLPQPTYPTYAAVGLLGAISVLRNKQDTGGRTGGGTRMSCRMTATAEGCVTAYPLASTGAITQTTITSKTTEAGASRCTSRGGRTVPFSCGISHHYRDGTSRNWSSIGQTLIKAMSRVTYSLSLGKITAKIGAKFKRCKTESPNLSDVYDIALAGPNNRFTIVSKLGALVVHNCGYQGGVGAFITMAEIYHLDLYSLSATVMASTPAELWDAAAVQYAQAESKAGLQEKEWTAIKCVVNAWRAAHPRIVQSWWDLQDAAIEAVANPGTVINVTRVAYFYDNQCLWCQLPSGRMICYQSPRIEEKVVEYVDKNGETRTRIRRGVSFWGYKEGKWRKLYLYGGLQCENIVQGIARDIMVDRMFAVEEKGYPIILTVHDELLCEVEASELGLNEKDFENVMSILPPWATGLPLAAKAWGDVRYVK